ncbi:MAG: hypothetical protein J2P31_19005 [Blastocatellia bacterium]|nr:hypothetical protein [Blastocatellia bacterium]
MSYRSARLRRLRGALAIALIMAVGGYYSLLTGSVLAQSEAKAAGELSVKGNVTINGTSAISGSTIFSNSLVKTQRGSGATINLGKLGHVQLGPDSEMMLRFAKGLIEGNLISGRAVLNTPPGVALNIATADGVTTADGKQATGLIVDVTCGNTRVSATRNGARVAAGGKEQYVAAGSEVAVGQPQTQTQAPRCARLSTAREPGLSRAGVAALVIAGVGGATGGIVAATQADNVSPSQVVVSGIRP